MNYPIRILSDIRGQIVAVVDINGNEYTVQMNSTVGTPIERNKLIRKMAVEQANKADRL